LIKLEEYSVGYKTSDIGLKDYYPNNRFSLHLGIVEWFDLCAKYVA